MHCPFPCTVIQYGTNEIAVAIESSTKDIVGVTELAMNQLYNMQEITSQINDNQRIANELRGEVDKFRYSFGERIGKKDS